MVTSRVAWCKHRAHGKVPLSLPVTAPVAASTTVTALDASPAFDGGPQANVIVTRLDHDTAGRAEPLLTHEARHATQFAWCGGVLMLPLYFLAAGLSWLLTGDFASRNVFERRAGLAEGGYAERPLRAAFTRLPPRRPGSFRH